MADNLGDIYQKILEKTGLNSFTFCELLVEDWDSLLTPWAVAEGLNGRSFAGNAIDLLSDITNNVIPSLKDMYDGRLYIAGYSLAGLFSLWALYELDFLSGAAVMSGSLWYPGWDEYASKKSISIDKTVYISLGKKEEKTKNPLLSSIGDKTRKQHELLTENGNTTILCMNEGGHFTNVDRRVIDGISWILQN